MLCPTCNDPSHIEKMRELICGCLLMWCPECDLFFFATRWWVLGPDKEPVYVLRSCDAQTVADCQDATG